MLICKKIIFDYRCAHINTDCCRARGQTATQSRTRGLGEAEFIENTVTLNSSQGLSWVNSPFIGVLFGKKALVNLYQESVCHGDTDCTESTRI